MAKQVKLIGSTDEDDELSRFLKSSGLATGEWKPKTPRDSMTSMRELIDKVQEENKEMEEVKKRVGRNMGQDEEGWFDQRFQEGISEAVREGHLPARWFAPEPPAAPTTTYRSSRLTAGEAGLPARARRRARSE